MPIPVFTLPPRLASSAATALLAAGSLAWAPTAAAADTSLPRERLFEAAASVLKVEVIRQQGGYGLGSGVVVAPEQVVTNCHVTQPAVRIVVIKGDERWPVQAQHRAGPRDLCLLHVPGLPSPAARLGTSGQLRVGQAVHAVGFTGGLGLQHSSGQVVALHRHDGAQVIQSDNWFSSGASGGALFDAELRLVGILTFRLRGGERHYYSSPADWIAPLIAAGEPVTSVAPGPPDEPWYWRASPPARAQGGPEQARFLHAAALQREGRWQELEAMARRWVEADSDNPAPWSALGRALEALGRLPEASRALETSLRLAPEAASVLLQSGRLALQMGDRQRAQEIKTRLERLDPALSSEFSIPASPR